MQKYVGFLYSESTSTDGLSWLTRSHIFCFWQSGKSPAIAQPRSVSTARDRTGIVEDTVSASPGPGRTIRSVQLSSTPRPLPIIVIVWPDQRDNDTAAVVIATSSGSMPPVWTSICTT